MSGKRNVYIVTQGEYSDYRICAVFSKKEVADDFAGRIGGDVEEHQLNTTTPKRCVIYNARLDVNGNEKERWTGECWSHELTEYDDNFGEWNIHGAYGRSTRSYDVALKIARDKLAELKARQEGI